MDLLAYLIESGSMCNAFIVFNSYLIIFADEFYIKSNTKKN